MTAVAAPSVILQNRALIAPGSERAVTWAMGLALAALFVASPLALYLLGRSVDPAHAGELLASAWEGLRERPLELAMLVAGLLLSPLPMLYVSRARRDERLMVSAQGLEYVSPLPRALRFLQPSWTVRWTQVHRASLVQGQIAPGPQFVQLVLDLGLERRQLLPYLWVDPQTYRRPNPWDLRDVRRRAEREAVLAELRASALVTAVARHVPNFAPDWDAASPARFALEKNPWTLGAVIAFFGLLVYALLDGLFLGLETYAERPFHGLCFAAGGATAFALFGLLRRARTPASDSVALALLTGAAFGAALYPGLLRLNQLTDTRGLQTHAYEHRGGGRFVAREDGLPTLELPQYAEYWAELRTGARYDFALRRGGLGFYQLDLAPLHAAMREHYRQRHGGRSRQEIRR